MTTKIWCKQLLMIKPDPAPYLLVAKSPRVIRLLAAEDKPLYWTNPMQIIEDTLSNAYIGKSSYDIVFDINCNRVTAGACSVFSIKDLFNIYVDSLGITIYAPWKTSDVCCRINVNMQSDTNLWKTIHITGGPTESLVYVGEDVYSLYSGDELDIGTAGKLTVNPDWGYIKNVRALKL